MASPQKPSLRGLGNEHIFQIADLRTICYLHYSIIPSLTAPRSDKRKSKSVQAGLLLPVTRFHKKLRKGKYGRRVGVCGSVYLTAAIEYLCVEILEGAQIEADNEKKHRITPRHVSLTISRDAELHELLKDVVFPQGGVVPHVHEELLPKKSNRVSKSVP